MINVSVVGAKVVSKSLAGSAASVGARARKVVRHHTSLLATRVKARASGRPGPRAPTGDYRRSITTKVTSDPAGTITGAVGTNRPQGRRLEMGFVGVDSLGRRYNQPPYPHFGPAFDETVEPFIEALEEGVI